MNIEENGSSPLKANKIEPTKGERIAAQSMKSGWIYRIRSDFKDSKDVPPEAVIGAWKVDDNGNIVGEFISNPNFRSKSE